MTLEEIVTSLNNELRRIREEKKIEVKGFFIL